MSKPSTCSSAYTTWCYRSGELASQGASQVCKGVGCTNLLFGLFRKKASWWHLFVILISWVGGFCHPPLTSICPLLFFKFQIRRLKRAFNRSPPPSNLVCCGRGCCVLLDSHHLCSCSLVLLNGGEEWGVGGEGVCILHRQKRFWERGKDSRGVAGLGSTNNLEALKI